MNITKKYLNDLTYKVIGCDIEVHKLFTHTWCHLAFVYANAAKTQRNTY